MLGNNGDDGKGPQGVVMKGHEFVQITFHMPASCDGCTKQLWAPFRPPPAMECKRESTDNFDTRKTDS